MCMKQKITILNKEKIDHKLRRMAYEIWEHNSEETSIVLVGIERGGRVVADNLANILRTISPLAITVLSIQVNKRNPINNVQPFSDDLTGRSVVVVDDVANSGKTATYALQPLLNYDMKKLMIAVLVDRKHKSFPIASDIVGLSLATTLQEHIEVEIVDGEITSVYLQ
ncbi:MAG: phosphoribosyltransferase [Chitinophagia bacterium]|nr:phosphoribosyltransferase [Chitinophagia bacterium]